MSMIIKNTGVVGYRYENGKDYIERLSRLTLYEKMKLEHKGLDLTSRIVGGTIAGGTVGGVTALALAPLLNIAGIPKNYAEINIKNIFSNISLVMVNLFKYYFVNQAKITPSCVIAGIPMPSLQELSHAMSDRILKYRATGGIFLAHQDGGEQSLRIVGKAFGSNRYWFLTALDFLFLYGSAKVVDLFTLAPTIAHFGIPDAEKALVPSLDPWKQIDPLNINDGREEAHLTFPVVTKSKIYTNMYIETYEFTESVENGMNCVTYSIFLRKYLPSHPYKYAWFEDEYGNILWHYAPKKDDELISRIRKIDLAMEVGFSTAMLLYRFFQHLAGNSTETNIAHITGINLNTQGLGENSTSLAFREIYKDLTYNLSELSTSQKEELFQIE